MSIVTNLKCTLAVTAGLCSSFAYAQKHPHVILIMTDQQRGDALGCMGNEAVISPNLDRLAGEGTLFMNGYSSCPSSTPARAGMLTGLSPWHHGLLGYGEVSPEYKYEMPQMMKDAGYYTFGIGKMHWHPQNVLHGFEATILDESGRVESPYFMSDYRKWFNTQAFGLDPDSTGVEWNAHEAKAYALPERLHPTVWTGDRAVEAIKGYSSEQPLFLKVSFARPHSPYDPPRRIVDMYEGREIVPIQFLKALLPDPASLGPRTKGKTNIGCIFTGVKDGKEKTYYIYNICDHQECYKEVGSQAISYTTGVPAMCGALMMLTGKWIRPGVYTVEEFDPDPFLEALDKYGLPRSENHDPKLVD